MTKPDRSCVGTIISLLCTANISDSLMMSNPWSSTDAIWRYLLSSFISLLFIEGLVPWVKRENCRLNVPHSRWAEIHATWFWNGIFTVPERISLTDIDSTTDVHASATNLHSWQCSPSQSWGFLEEKSPVTLFFPLMWCTETLYELSIAKKLDMRAETENWPFCNLLKASTQVLLSVFTCSGFIDSLTYGEKWSTDAVITNASSSRIRVFGGVKN